MENPIRSGDSMGEGDNHHEALAMLSPSDWRKGGLLFYPNARFQPAFALIVNVQCTFAHRTAVCDRAVVSR